MAFTAVYVLVDHGRGAYASMAEVSVRALRRVQPGVPAVLIGDEDSRAYLTRDRGRLLGQFDRVIWAATDLPNLVARSFELKTRVRSLVAGDLAYLDGDTLPVRPFADLFERTDWDVALVQDRNHHRPVHPTAPNWIEPKLQKHRWSGPLQRYFNAGIQYLRDVPAVHQLVAEWRERLWESHAVGEHDDQLPLNYTLHTTAVPVRLLELPAAYNAMVAAHPVHARGAKVLHFFAGPAALAGNTLLGHLVRHLDATGEIDWPSFDRAVARGHPWVPPYWPRRLWQTGSPVRAVATALGQRLKLLPKAANEEAR
ncbi:hypothetical protein R5W23_002767 [Gemmata sp. JC673]|uniref:Nucleotide-diphospho-sugar transferase domain-containing protein n=1 Tax=Gemmata algarum TaxID=2975278 RepID=A0ABU5F1W2_9BACT|nr:hypothetical protein [Gemmata algarum]MDY3561489.1 hypothetical protein [Gemmata algarum]